MSSPSESNPTFYPPPDLPPSHPLFPASLYSKPDPYVDSSAFNCPAEFPTASLITSPKAPQQGTTLLSLSDDLLYHVAKCLGSFSHKPCSEEISQPKHLQPCYLLSLARCSRRLHMIVEPVLYSHFHITKNASVGAVQIQIFLSRILERPDLAARVRVIHLAGPDHDLNNERLDMSRLTGLDRLRIYQATFGAANTTKEARKWTKAIQDGNWDASVALLLTLVPNLEQLEIEAWQGMISGTPFIMQRLEHISNLQICSEVSNLALRRLRRITIEHDDPQYGGELTPLLPFLSIPSVKFFYCRALDEAEGQCDEPNCSLDQFNVTELILHDISIHEAVLVRFMHHFPSLRRFQYVPKLCPFISLLPPSLLKALRPIRLILEDLSIINLQESYGYDEGEESPLGSLVGFERLQSLEIDLSTLLGRNWETVHHFGGSNVKEDGESGIGGDEEAAENVENGERQAQSAEREQRSQASGLLAVSIAWQNCLVNILPSSLQNLTLLACSATHRPLFSPLSELLAQKETRFPKLESLTLHDMALTDVENDNLTRLCANANISLKMIVGVMPIDDNSDIEKEKQEEEKPEEEKQDEEKQNEEKQKEKGIEPTRPTDLPEIPAVSRAAISPSKSEVENPIVAFNPPEPAGLNALSNEVLALIIQFVGTFVFNPEDKVCIPPEPLYLLNLAMSSHRLYDIVSPILYTHFHQRRSTTSDSALPSFLCAILRKPKLARSVQIYHGFCPPFGDARFIPELKLDSVKEGDWGLIRRVANSFALDLGVDIHETLFKLLGGDWDAFSTLILYRLPNIQEVEFDGISHPPGTLDSSLVIKVMQNSIGLKPDSRNWKKLPLQKVRRVAFQGRRFEESIQIQNLFPFLQLPNLQSFACRAGQLELDSIQLLQRSEKLAFNITELRLHNGIMEPEALALFLRCCPKVKKLYYHHDEESPLAFAPPEFLDAITHAFGTLSRGTSRSKRHVWRGRGRGHIAIWFFWGL